MTSTAICDNEFYRFTMLWLKKFRLISIRKTNPFILRLWPLFLVSHDWNHPLHIYSILAFYYLVGFNEIPLISLNSSKYRPRAVKHASYVSPIIPGITLVNLLQSQHFLPRIWDTNLLPIFHRRPDLIKPQHYTLAFIF